MLSAMLGSTLNRSKSSTPPIPDPLCTSPMAESRHVGVWIDRPAEQVYAFAGDIDRLPQWAFPFAMALGDIRVEFATANEFGVLDHVVTLPSGKVIYVPMRVIPAGFGEPRCEVVLTLRRRDLTDEQFDADAAAMAADLQRLKSLVEAD